MAANRALLAVPHYPPLRLDQGGGDPDGPEPAATSEPSQFGA